jgi:hypothetical protein
LLFQFSGRFFLFLGNINRESLAVCELRHVQGICDHLANIMKEMHGLDFDPRTDMAICCGQTEAFAAAVFASMLCTLILCKW